MNRREKEYNLRIMYIPMKRDILTISALLLVIIFLAIWFSSTPAYVPYSSTLFSQQAKFEGFSTKKSLEYSSTTNNSAVDGPVSGYLLQSASGIQSVPGFGVFNTPDIASKEKLDIYSDAPGDLNAEGSGYYNSRGSLVLDENMKKMLSTRGANSTGQPTQIGGSAV
jgi:hypothetical protein